MANSGPHTNGCQFFITTAPADFLDGKHVCFGSILDGGDNMLILRKIENVPTGANNRPKLTVKITGASDVYTYQHMLITFVQSAERCSTLHLASMLLYLPPLRLLPLCMSDSNGLRGTISGLLDDKYALRACCSDPTDSTPARTFLQASALWALEPSWPSCVAQQYKQQALDDVVC